MKLIIALGIMISGFPLMAQTLHENSDEYLKKWGDSIGQNSFTSHFQIQYE